MEISFSILSEHQMSIQGYIVI